MVARKYKELSIKHRIGFLFFFPVVITMLIFAIHMQTRFINQIVESQVSFNYRQSPLIAQAAPAWGIRNLSEDPVVGGGSPPTGAARVHAMVIDSTDTTYVAWYEDVGSSVNEVFFWDSSLNQIRNISDDAMVGGGTAPNGTANEIKMAIDNLDNIYVAWYQNDGTDEDLYLWNNSTNQIRNLSEDPMVSGNAPSGYARTPAITFDSSDNVIVVWYEIEGANSDVFLWQSASNQIRNISEDPMVSGTAPNFNASPPRLAIDSSDNVIVVWEEGYDIFYWNNSTNQSRNINQDPMVGGGAAPGVIANAPEVEIDSSDNVLITWRNAILSAFDYHQFFWSSATNQARNISDDVMVGGGTAPTTGASFGLMQKDSLDNVYITFGDSDGVDWYGYLWTSVSNQLRNITEDPMTGGGTAPAGSLTQIRIAIDSSDTPKVIMMDSNGVDFDTFFWDGATNQITNLSEASVSGGGSAPNGASSGTLIDIDSSDVVYAAWTENDGTDYDTYLWDSTSGTTKNLSESTLLNGTGPAGNSISQNLTIALNSSDAAQVVWYEDDGTDYDVFLYYYGELSATSTRSPSSKVVYPSNIEVQINNDDICTASPEVEVYLSAVDANEFVITDNERFLDSEWQYFPGPMTVDWTFDNASGDKTIYVMYRSITKNRLDPVSDTIKLDLENDCNGDEECVVSCEDVDYELYIVNPDGSERSMNSNYAKILNLGTRYDKISFEDKGSDFDYNDLVF
ncbi:MAG: hypothetical protein ABH846_01100, partial [Patescibacteria group bacterium]